VALRPCEGIDDLRLIAVAIIRIAQRDAEQLLHVGHRAIGIAGLLGRVTFVVVGWNSSLLLRMKFDDGWNLDRGIAS
jgi:hypothetical protein